MRAGLLALVVGAAASAAAPAAPAGAATISAGFGAFTPQLTEALTGETVTWSNDSVRTHTVTADDGSFDSDQLVTGDAFAWTFDRPGPHPYHCRIHAGMSGEVDVYDLLLDTPAAPAGPGRTYPLAGRSSLAPGTPVTIEGDSGSGFAAVADTEVAHDGTVAASVTPATTTAYRAVAGDSASPPIRLLVLDHTIVTHAQRVRGHRLGVDVTVSPAAPGGTVVLQLRRRYRFGWWPEQRRRLDADSHARFVVALRHRVPARVVLTLADGATVLATGREQRRY